MLSKHTPTHIGSVPTAQTVYDALSVSEYMDHVVDAWISAYMTLQIEMKISAYVNRNKDIFESADTEDYKSAKAAFDAAYNEMLYRFNEHRSSGE